MEAFDGEEEQNELLTGDNGGNVPSTQLHVTNVEDDMTDPENDEPEVTSARQKTKKASEGGSYTAPGSQYPVDPAKSKKHNNVALVCVLVWCLLLCALAFFIGYRLLATSSNGGFPDIADPAANLTVSTTKLPSIAPSVVPTLEPSIEPTSLPILTPSLQPSSGPSKQPTTSPTSTAYPSSDPTTEPTIEPTTEPTVPPTKSPSIRPSPGPTLLPTSLPTALPTNAPSTEPTSMPTPMPSMTPTAMPSDNPSASPTSPPSIEPTDVPTSAPTDLPTRQPSIFPTKSPSTSPTVIPSAAPTPSPSTDPTRQPTISPVSMILQIGNTIVENGIEMTFPPNAFPDSLIQIVIGAPNATTRAIFDDTASAFQAMSMDGISGNSIRFIVENMPLNTSNVTYETVIPIPADLLSDCPANFGFEIFTLIEQRETPTNTTFPVFVLFESVLDRVAQTLTTHLVPEMFQEYQADVIVSCTPGVNTENPNPQAAGNSGAGGGTRRRQLLQNSNYATLCRATPVECPILGAQCIILSPYGPEHDGVDYAPTSTQVIAAAGGVIERSEQSVSYGQLIIIRHNDGSATLYGNLLSSNESVAVVGNRVTQGTVIATIDTHLHFEYIPNGLLYATKRRVDVSQCLPANPSTPAPVDATTLEPTKMPLVPPNTYPPTAEPTTTPIHLPEGSITVRDSGNLADDAFAISVDGFHICETEIGQMNTCAINFLRPGIHTLTLNVTVAPDRFGTWNVKLIDGWEFTDGTTEKDSIRDYPRVTPPVGWTDSWNFIVPPN